MIAATIGGRRRSSLGVAAMTVRRQVATTSALQVGGKYLPNGMRDMTYRHTAVIAADCTALVFSVVGEGKTCTGRLGVRINGTLRNVLWDGEDGFDTAGYIQPLASDPLSVTITAGTEIVVSYHLDYSAVSNQHPAAKSDVGSLAAYGPGDLIESDTGWDSTTSTGFLPIPTTITALTYPSTLAVVVVGDSIAESGSGNPSGYTLGVRQANLPTANFARWAGSYPSVGDAGYTGLTEFTHVLCEYGFNDLSNDPTVADSMADGIDFWGWMLTKNPALKITQCTITPASDSTDGWTTLAGQTPWDDGRDDRTRAFNNWIRDGSPILAGVAAPGTTDPAAIRAGDAGHPLAGWLEIADTVESSRDSGIFRVDFGALTVDGAHMNSTGGAFIAAAVKAWAETLTI